VLIVGHGSLTSAAGLAATLPHVERAWICRLETRRGFGKPPKGRAYLATDVATAGRAVLRGARVEPGAAPGASGFEGLAVEVGPATALAVAIREGYPEPCWRRLADAAGPRGPAALLLELAREAGDDALVYRRRLHEVAGPTTMSAYHYLPHPVDLGPDAEPALTYVGPEVGETGDPGATESCKTILPAGFAPVTLAGLWDVTRAAFGAEFQHERQLRYAKLVLLAAAHGLDVSDLGHDGPAAAPVRALIRSWTADRVPLEVERRALRDALGEAAYAAAFVAEGLEAALERSGLWGLV